MADWRGGKSRRDVPPVSKPVAHQATASSSSQWRRPPQAGRSSSTNRGLWVKRWLTSGAVLTLVVALVAIFLLSKVPTPLVILSVNSYKADPSFVIPRRPGATGEFDVWKNEPKQQVKPIFSEKNRDANLNDQLNSITSEPILSPGGPNRNVLLVSIAAQGVVNGKGEPFLLDSESKPFDEETWTSVKFFFNKLKDRIGASEKRNVVVFFDSGVGESDWSMGWLHDGFEAGLEKLLRDSDLLPKKWQLVHVRGTADLSTFADSGRRVLFADVLNYGLRGAADGVLDQRRDKKISLPEMIRFIEKETGKPPFVWPSPSTSDLKKNGISLCWAEGSGGDHKLVPLKVSSTPEKLKKLWVDHYEIQSDGRPWRQYPWDWARFEWQLLRAERAWLSADEKTFDEIVKAASSLMEKIKGPQLGTNGSSNTPNFNDDVEWEKFLSQIEQSKNFSNIPDTPPKHSPAAVLAFLLNRDVLKFEATQAMNNQDAIAKLIRLRRVAESDVWPQEFRAEAIVRNQADRIDKDRLDLEDLAFVGGEQNLKKIADDSGNVRNSYNNAKKLTEKFADRLNARDEMLAKLPWWFRWADVTQSQNDQRQLTTIWNDVAQTIRNFDTSVQSPPDELVWGTWDDAYKQFKELKDLATRADDSIKPNKLASREWTRTVLPFLATPLVSGGTRNQLFEKLVEKLSKVDEPVTPATNNRNKTPFSNWESHPLHILSDMFNTFDKVSVDDGTSRLEKFPDLESGDNDSLTSSWLKAEEQQRTTLKNAKESSFWSKLLKKQPDNRADLSEHYRSLVKHDGQGRALAVELCAGEVSGEETPQNVIARLDQLQQVSYFDWRVRRALVDFYGPADLAVDRSEPFYQTHAKEWLEKLESGGASNVYKKMFVERLNQSLEHLSKLDTPLLHVEVSPSQLEFLETDKYSKPVNVKISTPVIGDLGPAGTISLEIPQQQDSPNGFRLEVAELFGSSSKSPSWSKEISVMPGTTPAKMPAFFRGHRALDAAVTRNTTKLEPAIERDAPSVEPNLEEATVVVKGSSMQELWLMVVLDCSFSMNDTMKIEKSEVTRFSVARGALKDMLKSLPKNGGGDQTALHVGLMAYGYRVGLNLSKKEVRYSHPSEETTKAIPPRRDELTFEKDQVRNLGDLDPSLDVGILVPFQQDRLWNAESYGEMEKKIDRLNPIGVTPLYLSIAKAAAQMEIAPKDARKFILVITDGVDNQTTLGWPASQRQEWGLNGFKTAEKTGAEGAKDKLAKLSEVNIRIVGLGVDDEDKAKTTHDRDGIIDLKQFCSEENNIGKNPAPKLVLTQSGEQLARQLRVHSPVKFRVRAMAENGDDKANRTSTFGSPIELERPAGKNFHVDVFKELEKGQSVLASTENTDNRAPITVHGGEHFELLYVNPENIDGGGRLVFHRGWEGIANDNQAITKGSNSLTPADNVRNAADIFKLSNQSGKKWQAALLATKFKSGEASFRIAFRPSSDTESPARPKLVRAVITPLTGGEKEGLICPYYFESKDARFEARQSVPVLEFVGKNWKPEWKQANLTVWLRAPGDEPDDPLEKSITTDLKTELGKELSFAFEGLNGASRMKIGQKKETESTVTVKVEQSWEKFDPASSLEDLPILQVEPSPKQTKRRVQVSRQQVEYEFTFSTEDFRQTKYQLLVLDPAKLPRSSDQDEIVKKLRWEKINLEK